MFEKSRDYPTAYVVDGPTDALDIAVRWVLQASTSAGGEPLLHVPTKANIQHNPRLVALGSKWPVVTHRQTWNISWAGGPVLALWPDQKHLGLIADNPRTKALCVVTSYLPEVEGWAAASGARNLDPARTPDVALPEIDPVVRAALKSLGARVNHSNRLAGSMDRADAVTWFRVLTRAGYRLDPEALHAHALADGWPGPGADRLKEMAVQVAAGKSLRGWNEPRWNPDVVERWRVTASDDSAS